MRFLFHGQGKLGSGSSGPTGLTSCLCRWGFSSRGGALASGPIGLISCICICGRTDFGLRWMDLKELDGSFMSMLFNSSVTSEPLLEFVIARLCSTNKCPPTSVRAFRGGVWSTTLTVRRSAWAVEVINNKRIRSVFFIVLFFTIRCLSWLANCFCLTPINCRRQWQPDKEEEKSLGSTQTYGFTAFVKQSTTSPPDSPLIAR